LLTEVIIPEGTMRPTKTDNKKGHKRRAWQPPTMTKLAIGAETKSAEVNADRPQASPQPPVAPTTKLGFSVEWAFPLSQRFEK
jgi:hypothetical protein